MNRQTRFARLTILPFLAIAALVTATAFPIAARAELDEAGKKEMETLIHDYLMEHGDVIIQAVEKHQQEQQQAAEREQQSNLKNHKEYLLSPDRPSTGPADADVTVVEFFDYNCGFCKKALHDVQALLKDDKKLRVVFIDIPILGESSNLAAQWALASQKQGKYFEYHAALMSHNGPKTEETLAEIAKNAGLDVERLKKDLVDPNIGMRLAEYTQIAQDLGISGTPGFIIGEEIHRGYIGEDAMLEAVKKARESAKN